MLGDSFEPAKLPESNTWSNARGPSYDFAQRDRIRYADRGMPSEPNGVSRILAQAAEALGSCDAAESWMLKPAMGLNGQRPIDLLDSKLGVEVVTDFLVRLDYNVYC